MSRNYPQLLVTQSLHISVQQRSVVNKVLTLKKKKIIEVMGRNGGEGTAFQAGATCAWQEWSERGLVGTRRIDSTCCLGGGVRVPGAHTGQPPSLTAVPGLEMLI